MLGLYVQFKFYCLSKLDSYRDYFFALLSDNISILPVFRFSFLIGVCVNFYCYSLVKNRKEATRIAIMESLSAKKTSVEELKRHVQDQRAKRDEYAEIIIHQSSGIPFNYVK